MIVRGDGGRKKKEKGGGVVRQEMLRDYKELFSSSKTNNSQCQRDASSTSIPKDNDLDTPLCQAK